MRISAASLGTDLTLQMLQVLSAWYNASKDGNEPVTEKKKLRGAEPTLADGRGQAAPLKLDVSGIEK